MTIWKFPVAIFMLALVGLDSSVGLAASVPLTRAHAHNDYLHARPLLDALEQGFCSVEADVFPVDGQLLVAHTRSQAQPGRTLQALYLDPLRGRIRLNRGHVYRDGPEFILLVELKTDWHASYPLLHTVLLSYSNLLTSYSGEKKQTGAITVIITGHRSKEMFEGEKTRLAALDGDLTDLKGGVSAELVPWISSDWSGGFQWRGEGAMPSADRLKLKGLVAQAHAQNRRVRFWGAPDRPEFWAGLIENDVDLINTDDLAGVHRFLTGVGR